MKKSHVIFLVPLIFAFGCGQQTNQSKQLDAVVQEDKALQEQASVYFKVLPAVAENPENPMNAEKVLLGKMLFYDTKLSNKGNNSCNSCHNLSTYGVDNLPTSPGDEGISGKRNSPTVLNAALHMAQFWDGRAKDVEEQAGGPVLNPGEMAMPDEESVVKRISEVKEYRELFAKAFPNEENPIQYKNMQKAIGAFERTLLTPSPFDEFLATNTEALSASEQQGLRAFMETGCTACHSGAVIGGNMYQKFGIFSDYITLTKSSNEDLGRYGVTNQESDKYMFKVPSLRNVTMTYPYFHDGSISNLEEAIGIMAKAELNKDLTSEQIKNIASFLNTLTGKVPEDAMIAPTI